MKNKFATIYFIVLAKILCKWKQGSVVSFFLNSSLNFMANCSEIVAPLDSGMVYFFPILRVCQNSFFENMNLYFEN
jgi:hypothetical protein